MSAEPSTPAAAGPSSRLPWDPTPVVYLVYVAFMAWWFRIYFSTEPIAAVDLPGHIQAMHGLRSNLLTLGYTFYDISCFTGYAAFQFYSFLVHWAGAILSVPLTLISSDPVRLSSHLLLVLAMMTLPLPWIWAVRPWVEEIMEHRPEHVQRARWWTALTACAFSFWFINHDYQWWGIGAAAVMNIGLFSQAFGWHFMIMHIGSLTRLLRNGRPHEVRWTAIWFAILLLTHTMTAVFSFYIAFMALLWYRERRWDIIKAHAIAALLMAFWVLPMAAFLTSYTGLDIHRPQGDFFEVFFRYPFFAYFRVLRDVFHGQFVLIGATEPTLVFLATSLVAHRHAHRSTTLVTFAAFLALGLCILTSGFIATSVPMGFHYYRFMAYMMLFALVVLTPATVFYLRSALAPGRPDWMLPAYQVVFGGLMALCWITTAALPHNERDKVMATANKAYLSNEYKVLDFFRNQPEKGRVLFEYFSDYGRYPFLSCHFMSTSLWRETGHEAINGLFVQSSLAYHFPMGAANQLKANSYNGPLLYPSVTDLTDDARVAQMKEYGISWVVAGGDEFFNKMKPYSIGEPVVIGLYKILKLQEHPTPVVTPVHKHVVAYADLKGNVPFKYVELYFYAKQQLSPNYEVLAVKPGDDLPPQVEVVLLHGSASSVESAFEKMKASVVAAGGAPPRLVSFDYYAPYPMRHYGTWYQHNPEIDDFDDVGKFLNKLELVKKFPDTAAPPAAAASPAFSWGSNNQSFSVSGLQPGQLYRLNYSYFPYWHTFDGTLFRMSGDRMALLPKSDQASAFYTRWLSFSTWLGWALTALGLWWVWRDRKRHPAVA
ncbi:MAG: hypothetical protein HY904_24260 [Deltaproteobacteria bacterium]|nr:hypothetical protein [Deltaproteobacteria bacterium]